MLALQATQNKVVLLINNVGLNLKFITQIHDLSAI